MTNTTPDDKIFDDAWKLQQTLHGGLYNVIQKQLDKPNAFCGTNYEIVRSIVHVYNPDLLSRHYQTFTKLRNELLQDLKPKKDNRVFDSVFQRIEGEKIIQERSDETADKIWIADFTQFYPCFEVTLRKIV